MLKMKNVCNLNNIHIVYLFTNSKIKFISHNSKNVWLTSHNSDFVKISSSYLTITTIVEFISNTFKSTQIFSFKYGIL